MTTPPGGEVQARAFYGGLLGLPEIPRAGSVRNRPGVWFDTDGLDLHLSIEAERTGMDALGPHR